MALSPLASSPLGGGVFGSDILLLDYLLELAAREHQNMSALP